MNHIIDRSPGDTILVLYKETANYNLKFIKSLKTRLNQSKFELHSHKISGTKYFERLLQVQFLQQLNIAQVTKIIMLLKQFSLANPSFNKNQGLVRYKLYILQGALFLYIFLTLCLGKKSIYKSFILYPGLYLTQLIMISYLSKQ